MKSGVSPKNDAGRANAKRAKNHSAKSKTRTTKLAVTHTMDHGTTREFKFEIITPQMQIEERNSAYQFFKP